MPRDPTQQLFDIVPADERIDRFVAGQSFENHLTDELTCSAIERQCQIDGHAP